MHPDGTQDMVLYGPERRDFWRQLDYGPFDPAKVPGGAADAPRVADHPAAAHARRPPRRRRDAGRTDAHRSRSPDRRDHHAGQQDPRLHDSLAAARRADPVRLDAEDGRPPPHGPGAVSVRPGHEAAGAGVQRSGEGRLRAAADHGPAVRRRRCRRRRPPAATAAASCAARSSTRRRPRCSSAAGWCG